MSDKRRAIVINKIESVSFFEIDKTKYEIYIDMISGDRYSLEYENKEKALDKYNKIRHFLETIEI